MANFFKGSFLNNAQTAAQQDVANRQATMLANLGYGNQAAQFGAGAYNTEERYRTDHCGMTAEATRHLIAQGVRMMGCDAITFDPPDHTKYRAVLNPHFAKRHIEETYEANVRKVTIASSSSVYGVNAKVPFSEADPIFSAISPYAASKLACEALGHVYHHVYGMDIAMLRFFTVYGPRQRPDLAIHKFASLIHAGKTIPVFGDGSTARDYTYVTDTVDGILACTRREFGFEIFNLGESQTVRLDYLVSLLEKALGLPANIDRQPPQPGDVPITYADITKARAQLGYNPSVKIEIGIPKFVEWFRATRK